MKVKVIQCLKKIHQLAKILDCNEFHFGSNCECSNLDIQTLNVNNLKTKTCTKNEMYNKINNLMFEDLKNFLDSYFNQLKIRILVQGNITKDHAVSIGNLVVDNLNAGRVIDAS